MAGTVTHEKSDINFIPALVGMLLMVGLVFLIFVISTYYFKSSTTNELNDKDTQGVALELKEIREKAHKELNSFGWANDSKTKVKVPIDSAINITIRDYKKR